MDFYIFSKELPAETTNMSKANESGVYNLRSSITYEVTSVVKEYQKKSPWSHFRGSLPGCTGLSVDRGPVTNDVVWIYKTSGSISASPVIGFDGTIYLGSQDLVFYALHKNGEVKWSYKTSGVVVSACLGYDGSVYVGSSDFNFYTFNASTGSLKWKYTTTNAITSSAAIGHTTGVIYVASGENLLAFTNTGTLKWSETFLSGVAFFSRSSPIISPTNGDIFIGTNANGMLAIRDLGFSGSLIWSFASQTILSTPALGAEGQLYFGCNDNKLYALDSSTGSKLWSFSTSGQIQSSPAVASDGFVYIGSNDNSLYSMSSSGTPIWSYMTEGDITSSAAIDANGVIYFGSFDGNLYALFPNGTKKWSYRNRLGSNIASSPAIGLNNTLYFGTAGNDVVAMGALHSLTFSPPTTRPIQTTGNNNSTNSGLPKEQLIAIITLAVLGFTVVLVGCLFRLLYRVIKIYGVLFQRDVVGSVEALFLSPTIPQRRLQQEVTGEAFNTTDNVIIPQVNWNTIEIDQVDDVESLIVGIGSFGTVYRAKLEIVDKVTKLKSKQDIAIKVMAQSLKNTERVNKEKYRALLEIAKLEAGAVIAAESRMAIKDSIIKVYGIASGSLPPQLSRLFGMSESCSAIGIVMRYEGGGSLQQIIHPSETAPTLSRGKSLILPMSEKLRLLTELAKGIADMHAAGIIHGDLKPDNVLLSSDVPCRVRLADFGLATLRTRSNLASTLQKTSATQGTPVYCAPEMFVNPYAQVLEDKVAKASRKTDMYAFALIAWEVLTQKKPFGATTKEMLLVAQIYSGARPPVEDIPAECPREVVDMIVQTWDIDRLNRRTAIECFNLLQFEYSTLSKQGFNVYISYEDCSFQVAKYIFYRLTQTGCVVCLIPVARRKDITDELQRSSVVVALLSQKFQETPGCMTELSEARNSKPPKKVYPVFLEADYNNWSDMQLQYLCQLKSSTIDKFDLSPVIDHFLIDESDIGTSCDDSSGLITQHNEKVGNTATVEVEKLVHLISNHLRSSSAGK